MKRILMFDAYASPDEVATESAATFRRIPGVISAEILSAVGGQPRYCVLLETDDSQDADVMAQINASLQNYAEYVSNVSNRAFRRIG